MTLPLFVDGGQGNDRILAGSGDDILLGGPGEDRISGGAGRDMVIGGADMDFLVEDTGDDLVIGGSTTFDPDRFALEQIMDEWASTRSYEDRIRNLSGVGTGPRANGNRFLTDGVTVIDDTARDTLFSDFAGRDWFWAEMDDRLLSRRPDEVIKDDLSPLGP